MRTELFILILVGNLMHFARIQVGLGGLITALVVKHADNILKGDTCHNLISLN